MVKTIHEEVCEVKSKTLNIKEITFELEKLYSMVIRLKDNNFKLKIICFILLFVLILTLCFLIFS